MEDSYRNEKFEEEDDESEKYKTRTTANSTDKLHKLRLSIDIRSIKDQKFRGLIYAKYPSVPPLGIKHFKTSPGLQVNKSVEEQFTNSFGSYLFEGAKSFLNSALSENPLAIEVFHQGRHQKDQLIGKAELRFEEILKGSIRKTAKSYVRVYDAYIPLDEFDEEGKFITQIASLRVITYLEDLGPVELIKERELDLEKEYIFDPDQSSKQGKNPVIPTDNYIGGMRTDILTEDMEKRKIFQDLNSLEYKIIWELETWKKSEEAKFKIMLKQKEVEHLSKINEEWRRKELDRDKVFKRTEAVVQQLENKMKSKAAELQRREQKIVLLEEELKQRITETARQITHKEEEYKNYQRKAKEDKGNSDKEKANLLIKLEEVKKKYSELENDFENYKKEQESSPVMIVKTELSKRLLEINELKKENEKILQMKEQYKDYYEKMRNEIVKMKKNYETMKEEIQSQSQKEIDQLKLQLNAISFHDERDRLSSMKNELMELKKKQNPSGSSGNPFKKNLVDNQSFQARLRLEKENDSPNYDWATGNLSERERLRREREFLLSSGEYQINDPLIVELEKMIENASH